VEQPDYRFPFKSKNQESGLATTTTTTRKKKKIRATGKRVPFSRVPLPRHTRERKIRIAHVISVSCIKRKKKLLYSSASTENNQ
jgi:hypothetical protein